MVKLALAAAKGAVFDGATVKLPVDRRTGEAAARQGGEAVLVYEIVPRTAVLFLGEGRIAGIDYETADRSVVVRLSDYVAFVTPVPRTEELKLPRVRAMLRLDDDAFTAIVTDANVPLTGSGAAEAQASLATRVSIKRQVLRNRGNRCAITGLTSGLDIVAIRPREAGGRLHVRNYMPMVPAAARAWEQGHISVGPNGDVVADLPNLDPDLLERMDRGGRLLVPRDPQLGPDPADLAFHLEHVFAQRRPA